jgi:hypothetical protein
MNTKTSIIAKIRELFNKEEFASDYTAATNEIIRCLGDGLKVGEKVVQVLQGEEGNLPDGNYLLNNGKTITVAAGEIKEINEYRAEEKMADYTTKEEKDTDVIVEKAGGEKDKMADYKNEIISKLVDGTEVKILSKGDALSVGDEVLVKDAEGKFINAPEGKHLLEGGLVLYVDARGFINELETEETDKTSESEEMKSMFEAVSNLTTLVSELKDTISTLKSENNELTEKFNKFAAEPSAETITKKADNLSKTAGKEERLKFFGGK